MVNKTNVLSIEILKLTFLIKIKFNEAKGKIEQVFFNEIFISEFYKNSTKNYLDTPSLLSVCSQKT